MWTVIGWDTREVSGVPVPEKSVFLGVGTSLRGCVHLLKYIKLYNYDCANFCYAGYTSKKFTKNVY